MHHCKCIEAGRDIIDYDPSPPGKFLELAHGRRFDDIEDSKKYKTEDKSFPREGDGDKGDELTGDLIDHNELRIF